MAAQEVVLTPGTTNSVQTGNIVVERNKPIFVGLYPYANLGSDTGTLEKLAPDDTWVRCTDDNGDIVLSATRTMEVIYGPGTYRLNVSTRTSAWGVWTERAY